MSSSLSKSSVFRHPRYRFEKTSIGRSGQHFHGIGVDDSSIRNKKVVFSKMRTCTCGRGRGLKAHTNGRNKSQHCCVFCWRFLANNVASVCMGLYI